MYLFLVSLDRHLEASFLVSQQGTNHANCASEKSQVAVQVNSIRNVHVWIERVHYHTTAWMLQGRQMQRWHSRRSCLPRN